MNILSLILVFFYIFGFSFKGGSGFDSAMFVGMFLFVYFLINKQYSKDVLKYFKSKYFLSVTGIYLLVNIWILIVVIINGSSDFSYFKTFLHMYLLVLIGSILYLFLCKIGKKKMIVNYVVIAFVLQTTIEWGAYLLPSFKTIINFTKSAETIAKGESYSGVRANALAGSDFFGLSAAYAMVSILYFSSYNTLSRNNRIIKIFIYLYMITGTFFAGRTGYIGVALAIIYILFKKITTKSRLHLSHREKNTLLFTSVVFLAVVIFFVKEYTTNQSIYNLINFTFQSFINKAENGSFMNSSMESLFKMYSHVNFNSLIFGDGLYAGKNGGYYMNTDVGYLRVMLLGGVLGLVLMFILQLKILSPKKCKERVLVYFIIFCLIILNFKGEVFAWGEIIIPTTLLFSLQNRKESVLSSNIYLYGGYYDNYKSAI